jgi:hypothetical protein
MVRFDGYTATTTAANPHQLAELFGPGLDVREGRGFHQFGHRVAFKDNTGTEVGSVQWGGVHGERSMLEVKGERTPEVVERLRSLFPHRVTRMDSCADFDAPRAFQSLYRSCLSVKRRHRLKGEKRGDWDDHPEQGRTFYVGSPQSVTMVRLYEKGKQPEYQHLSRDNWVRLEAQIRPAKEAKAEFASLSALDAWGASRWTRELAGLVLSDHVDPHPAGTTWRKSERDTALEWMCKQYGAHLLSLKADLGDWQSVGLTLGELLKGDSK